MFVFKYNDTSNAIRVYINDTINCLGVCINDTINGVCVYIYDTISVFLFVSMIQLIVNMFVLIFLLY